MTEHLTGGSAGSAGLPPLDTSRWSPQRKAAVVEGVRNGTITIEEACLRYRLSAEEFASWERAIEAHGVAALRATRVQLYRRRQERG